MKRNPIERGIASLSLVLILALWGAPALSLIDVRTAPPTETGVLMASPPPEPVVEEVGRVSSEAVVPQPEMLHIPHRSAISQKDLKYRWMAEAGINPEDFQHVNFIIQKESGWNPKAINLSSGACGLGQQLPCGKWPHRWDDPVGALIDASNYAQSRYGSWANAHSFWITNHYW